MENNIRTTIYTVLFAASLLIGLPAGAFAQQSDQQGLPRISQNELNLLTSLLGLPSSPAPAPAATGNPAPAEALLNTTIALPASCSVRVRWAQPPMGHAAAEKARLRIPDMSFSVDANGKPWIGLDDRRIVSPANVFQAKTSTPFTGFIHLDSGAMLVSTVTKLGFLVAPQNASSTDNSTPIASFQPVAQLPGLYGRLHTGPSDTLYVAVTRPGGKNDLYRLKQGAILRGFEKILETADEITGVAGIDKSVFVASGRLVYEVTPDTKRVTRLPATIPHPITGLAVDQRKGLIVSTSRGVSYLINGAFETIVETPNPRICVKKGTLYVFFPASLGVAAFDNIDSLADLTRK